VVSEKPGNPCRGGSYIKKADALLRAPFAWNLPGEFAFFNVVRLRLQHVNRAHFAARRLIFFARAAVFLPATFTLAAEPTGAAAFAEGGADARNGDVFALDIPADVLLFDDFFAGHAVAMAAIAIAAAIVVLAGLHNRYKTEKQNSRPSGARELHP
jgi:hypothetical protein